MKPIHKVPTHVSVPDKIVLGLTARQFLITLIGCSGGYDIWIQLNHLHAYGMLGMIVRLFCALIPPAVALGLALVSVAGRPLEVWLLVVVRYVAQPKRYVWRSVRALPGGTQASVEGALEEGGGSGALPEDELESE